jgi:hypothetical protein
MSVNGNYGKHGTPALAKTARKHSLKPTLDKILDSSNWSQKDNKMEYTFSSKLPLNEDAIKAIKSNIENAFHALGINEIQVESNGDKTSHFIISTDDYNEHIAPKIEAPKTEKAGRG